MKICSIDIGANNLAYTILQFNVLKDNKKQYINLIDMDILDFKLINLTNLNEGSEEPEGGCSYIYKAGKNKGKSCINVPIDGYDKCKSHLKDVEVKKKKRVYLNKKKLCSNIIESLKKTNMTDCDIILIEQQLGRNRIMTEISHYIYMFLLNKLVEENRQSTKIEYLSAKKRMVTLCTLFKDECIRNGITFKNNVDKYGRKQNAIMLVNYIISKKGNTKPIILENLRKKDDISDCIIQGLWYLIKNNIQLR